MTEITKNTFEDALYVAVVAHDGQRRKFSNQPYVVHPIRVAERAVARVRETHTHAYQEKLRIIAALHDVVEDTDVELGSLRVRGFDQEIVSAVDMLTRAEGMSYEDFIRRLVESKNELAIRVKIADLEDNMSDLKDGSLKQRYQGAMKELLAAVVIA